MVNIIQNKHLVQVCPAIKMVANDPINLTFL